MAQMCRPACEASYSEVEKMKLSSGSQGCHSSEYKHQEQKSGGGYLAQAGHLIGGAMHKHPSQQSSYSEIEKKKYGNGPQSGYSSEYKHQEEKSSGGYLAQAGHLIGSAMHKHPSPSQQSSYSDIEKKKYGNGPQGCYSSEYKHKEEKSSGYAMSHGGPHIGGMIHKNPSHDSHSSGHHGLSEKVTQCFGSNHGHNGSHHGHNGSHHHESSCEFSEKKEEHKSYKSGHVKSEMHIKKKKSYKGKCKDDDSSDSESDDEGCKKKC